VTCSGVLARSLNRVVAQVKGVAATSTARACRCCPRWPARVERCSYAPFQFCLNLLVRADPVAHETYTLTLLTTLRSDTGYHITTPRKGINTSIDFLEDIIELLDRGCLRRGDILVYFVPFLACG